MKKIIILFCVAFLFIACATEETEKLIPYSLDMKIGFVNQNMKIVIYPEFDFLAGVASSKNNTVSRVAKKEGSVTKYYLLNSNGKKKEIFGKYRFGVLSNGRYFLTRYDWNDTAEENEFGLPPLSTLIVNIDTNEKKIIKNLVFKAVDDENYIVAYVGDRESPYFNKDTYVDINGKPVFENLYRRRLGYFSPNENATTMLVDVWPGDYFIFTKQGEERKDKLFFYASRFSNGLFFGTESKKIKMKIFERDWGFYDEYGKLIIPVKILSSTKNEEVFEMYFGHGVVPVVPIDNDIYVNAKFKK